MKHLFVPSGIALMAKEKGFDEACLGNYEKHNNEYNFNMQLSPFQVKNNDLILAPFYQQLIDWFRNKHGIVIWIETAPYARTFNFRFYIETSDNRQEGNKSKDYYKVYNEALIEGFKLIKTN